jgi:spore coat protein U-like protein
LTWWRITLLAIAFAVLAAPAAQAQTCSIQSVSGYYGNIDVLSGAAVDTTATFSISCFGTAGQVVRACVELSPGQTNALGQRRLASGSDRLVHELYADAARSTIWGSWGLSTTAYDLYPYGQTVDINLGSFGSATVTLTVYGRVAANQTTAPPGFYVWSMTTAPAMEYDYRTGASCPTGTKQATSSGSSWLAQVYSNCLVSADALNFGSSGSLVASLAATGAVTVTCTNSTPYNVGLGIGTGSGASIAARILSSGGNKITYSIYKDAAHSMLWGNSLGYDTVSATGTGLAQANTTYGLVPAQSTPGTGTYSDTIVVTVTY